MKQEITLHIGDKVVISTPYGELFISIPHADYGWNEELIRFSSEKKMCIIPQASNSVELKMLDGYEILRSVDIRDERKSD